MELGSPAAGVGEDSRLLRREQEEGDLFSGGRNPAGGTPPSRHSDSHPLKHSGLPWQPHSRAGSAPPLRRQPVLLLSPHPRAPEDRAWAESAAPRTPLLLPLDLRLTWGSGKNRGRCGVSGQPARPGGLTHLGPVPPLKVRVASPVSHGLNWETQTSQTLKFPEAQSGDRRRCGLT